MIELPDLFAPLRTAIITDSNITALLTAYKGSYPVFTRIPVPEDTPFPFILIEQNTSANHNDGINDTRLSIVREITVYGSAEALSAEWRLVENIGRLIVDRFHRQPRNLVVPNWKVVQIIVRSRGFPPFDLLAQSVGYTAVLTIDLASAA